MHTKQIYTSEAQLYIEPNSSPQKRMVTKETALNLDQRAINISGFISARANELQEFTNILKTKMQNLNKLPFQLLPKHMRRRAMSHNKYRIPSRVREKIKEEDLLLKKPSRCRKSLRKSRLLLSSYARRSQKNKWLETHIWHAKRMNMRNYFGYKIAGTCGAKSNRAAYRYFKTDCLAYDLSYTLIFEVKSPYRERINDFVGSFVDKPSHEWNQFCNNQEIAKGAKKGTLTLWAGNPRKLVQRCEYIYRPRVNEESDYQIWFFLHPSCKDNLEQILSYSKSNDSIKCKLYDNCFNLFHIIGPDSCEKAYNLLQNIWNTQWNFETFISKHPITKAMKSITDPGVYPRNFVFHLSTEKRTEAKLLGAAHRIDNRTELSGLEDQEKINELMVELASYRYTLSENAKNLELWDFPEVPPENEYSLRFKNSTRGRFTHRKLQKLQKPVKTEVKNGKRKRNGKPQEEEPTAEKANQDPEALTTERAPETAPVFEEEKIEEVKPAENVMEEEKPVPNFPDKKIEIVLMHDEGEPQTCQGAGIKILVPCGQGLYIWRLLNYLGCKALGLQEYHHVLNETRKFVFPQDFPYSNGYEVYREVVKEEKLTKYFNKPPAKRINLIKIGSPFAFASDWELIIRENSAINNPLIPISVKENLVPVYVKMVKRRYPVDQAMICVPNSEELEKIKHYESQTKGGQDIIHTEPLNKCEFSVALKNVSREDYLDKLKEIKVSRKVGGFITTGNLSYRFATGCGKGYIVKSLLEELKPFEVARSQVRDTFESSLPYKSAFYMLIRNPSSRYYYACRVYVLNA